MTTGLLWINAIIAALGGFLSWFLGGTDGFLYALVAVVIADYLAGVFCAVHDRSLSSRLGWRGIFRKIVVFLLVGLGAILDRYVLLGEAQIIRSAIVFFYISNEAISLLEHATLLGLPIPEKLRDVLAQLRDRGKSKPNDGTFEGLEDFKK